MDWQDKAIPFQHLEVLAQSPPTATNTDNEAVVTITSQQVANNSITFAKIQDIATMKVIGRNSHRIR